MGHVTLTMPILGVVCRAIASLRAYFDNSSFSRYRDIIGGPKFIVDHMTLTTPPLRAICYFCAGT